MKPLRVLLIEDEVFLSKLFADVLDGMGHEVCCIAATEADAISGAASSKPDLMVVDVRLASGSGEHAVTEILRNGFVPHVFISGDKVRLKALRMNAVVLQKPFFVSDLAHAMQRALNATAGPLQLAIDTIGVPTGTRS